jgi:hypothetical protein
LTLTTVYTPQTLDTIAAHEIVSPTRVVIIFSTARCNPTSTGLSDPIAYYWAHYSLCVAGVAREGLNKTKALHGCSLTTTHGTTQQDGRHWTSRYWRQFLGGTNTDGNDKPSLNVRGSANMGSHQRSTISMRLFAFACVGGFLAKGNCICCTLTGDGLAE